jgi:hypothetical protein
MRDVDFYSILLVLGTFNPALRLIITIPVILMRTIDLDGGHGGSYRPVLEAERRFAMVVEASNAIGEKESSG